MKRFLTDNGFKPVETRDYAIAMEKASGQDLDWFFNQWAYGIGYPKVKVTRSWDAARKVLGLTVDQTQTIDSTRPFFRFPTTVRVVTRDSVVRQNIMITEQHQHFDMPLPGEPVTFRFDEGGWLLGTVTTDQSPAELAELARHDLEFAARYWALSRLNGSNDSVAQSARRFIALNDESFHLRQEAIRQLARDSSADSRTILRAALEDPSSEVRGQAIRTLALTDTTGIQAIAVSMIQRDPSYSVKQQALQVFDPATAPEGNTLLLELIAHGGSTNLRLTAASRLNRKQDDAGAAALESMTRPEEPRNVRQVALGQLAARTDKSRSITVATRYLNDGDPLFAATAVNQLATVGGAPGRATLQQALVHETRVTVRAAINAVLARAR